VPALRAQKRKSRRLKAPRRPSVLAEETMRIVLVHRATVLAVDAPSKSSMNGCLGFLRYNQELLDDLLTSLFVPAASTHDIAQADTSVIDSTKVAPLEPTQGTQ